MSRGLRYRNPIVCEHLAGQYVAGIMTVRVRSRMETLLASTPELDRAVAFWADQFSVMHEQLPQAMTPSKDIWQQIDNKITSIESSSGAAPQKIEASGWWQNLWLWKSASMAGMVTSLVLAMVLFFPVDTSIQPTIAGASYIAAMSAHNQNKTDIQFIISVYKKQVDKPSRLHVQWSQRHPEADKTPLHLWAEDKDSGELAYIGFQPSSDEAWTLTKPVWLAIANSSRLLMTSDSQLPNQQNTIFSGPCVQLAEWKS